MTDDDKREVALKYLDLARGEILEKARVVNQTLGAYLLGSAGLAGWFYQAVYKPVAKGDPSVSDLQKAYAAVGFALMLSYLALAVFWIIYHNERIIAALAFYQRESLSSALGDDPPMWEKSPALRDLDDLPKALKMVLAEESIVLGPSAVALVLAIFQACLEIHSANWTMRILVGVGLVAALAANVMTIRIGSQMRKTIHKLRARAAEVSAQDGGRTPRVMQLHPTQTQDNSSRDIQR